MNESQTDTTISESGESLHGYLDAGSLGRRGFASLPTLYARSVSLHDRSGHCHWRSSHEHATSEHLGVRAALEAFVGAIMPSRVDVHLRDGTSAVLLISRTGDGEYTGFVMLLVATERLRGKGRAAPDLPIPVIRAARHWGDLAAMHAAGLNPSTGDVVSTAPAAKADAHAPPTIVTDAADTARVLAAIQEFPIALHAQRLQPLNSEVRIRRYEILLRGADSSSSRAPLELLRDAEASGASGAMDRRVITALIDWLHQHLGAWRGEPSQFSINLTPSSLADREFLAFARDSLAASGLPPGLIAIEVEHRFAAQDRALLGAIAAACDELTVGLVIDNFTLHDNSVDLLSLPSLRLLKIARNLTTNLAQSRFQQAVIGGIAQMARLSGIHSVAKQVESADEHQLLANLGVDFAQGFAGAAPQALQDLKDDIDRRIVVDAEALIDPSLPDYLRVKPASG